MEKKIRLVEEIISEVEKEKGVINKKEENYREAHGLIVARLSQSQKPFKEIIKEIISEEGLNKQKISDFHKRITLGIKHHSIEQHANATVGLENISIIATNKYFENKRLASYLERSTRYQDFSTPSYYTPTELSAEQKKEYKIVMNELFSAYQFILPKIEEEVKRVYEQKGIQETSTNIKKKAFDSARYLLPASTHTNFAMSANSQTFRGLIIDLVNSNNNELISSAKELTKELSKAYPTLVSEEINYGDEERKNHRNNNQEINSTKRETEKIEIGEHSFFECGPKVKLINYTKNAEELITYQYLVSEGFYPELREGKVFLGGNEISEEEEKGLIKKLFTYNQAEEKPHRASELANYYFETIIDFGAGRDVHRNRMLTWIDSLVTPEHGYAVPFYLTSETKQEYINALTKAYAFWVKLIKNGVRKEIAQYVLPLATNYKVFYSLNAKELHHLAKTRTTKHAHYAYREYVHKLIEEAKKVQPTIISTITDHYENEACEE